MSAELLEAYSRRIAESDATIDYLRRRCEIQERLIAAWRDFAMCRKSSSNTVVMTREAEAEHKMQACRNELAALEKEHGDG